MFILTCTLCNRTGTVDHTPGDKGWTRMEYAGPLGNRYFVSCEDHGATEVLAALKVLLTTPRSDQGWQHALDQKAEKAEKAEKARK